MIMTLLRMKITKFSVVSLAVNKREKVRFYFLKFATYLPCAHAEAQEFATEKSCLEVLRLEWLIV